MYRMVGQFSVDLWKCTVLLSVVFSCPQGLSLDIIFLRAVRFRLLIMALAGQVLPM